MTWHHFLLLILATLIQETNASGRYISFNIVLKLLYYIIVFLFIDQTFALCADQRGFIRCKNGTKINIVLANYGRTDDKVCPGGKTETLTCRSKLSEIKVKWNCNGYATCHLHSTNRHFGNPCANIF